MNVSLQNCSTSRPDVCSGLTPAIAVSASVRLYWGCSWTKRVGQTAPPRKRREFFGTLNLPHPANGALRLFSRILRGILFAIGLFSRMTALS